jgi:hypothetical protein
MKKIYFLLLLVCGFVNAQIVNIPDVNFRVKLIELGVDTNGDSQIQLTEALNVTTLNVDQSNISSMTGVEAFLNLTSLSCGLNNISVLNVNNLTGLQTLICSYNNLSELNVSNLNNLQILYCQHNNLTALNISNLVNLTGLLCTYNLLMVLDVSNSPNLDHLACGSNLLTYLDISNNPLICTLSCASMVSLNRLNLKNGSTICLNNKILYENPNLRFVCVDNEAEAFYMQNYFQNNNMPNVNINTYCSFVPGGDYNIILGNVTFDTDNNGCDSNDIHLDDFRVNISEGANQAAVFTNEAGNYNLYTTSGNFTVSPNLENPTWFTFSPESPVISFSNINNNITTQNFCVSANGIHNDLEIVIIPITRARPGFDAEYKIVYKNKGNQTLSGDIDFTFDDNLMDYISASVVPDSQNIGTMSWNYMNLLPFETRNFTVIFNINSPVETPPVNIADELGFTATIYPVSGDESPADNVFSIKEIVVGSFDPNDKTCLEGITVSPNKIGDYLHYNINFENTGNFQAENIVVKDIIDMVKFDINSLRVLNTSHTSITRITENKVEFIFENINLDAGQHGNVTFKIKTKNTLDTGNTVTNAASIYFDYNVPEVTDPAITTFQALGVNENEIDKGITIYPNPVKNVINVNSKNEIKTIQLFDINGRVLMTKISNGLEEVVPIPDYSNGVYFLKVITQKGIKTQKIIKE